MRVLSWNLYHGRDFPPDPALLTRRSRLLRADRAQRHPRPGQPAPAAGVRALARGGATGRRAPPGGAAAVVRGARPADGLERRARAHVAQPPAGPAVAARRPQPRPAGLQRGRLEPDPGAPPGQDRRDAPPAAGPCGPSGGGCCGRGSSSPEGRVCVANLHASAGRPEAAARELVRGRGARARVGGRRPARVRRRLQPAAAPRPGGLRAPARALRPAASPPAPAAIDHLLARGLAVVEAPRRLEPAERELTGHDGRRIRLSDHAPVVARFRLP